MLLNVITIIIFIFLNIIIVIIIIINIVAMYRSQSIFILLIIIIKYQYLETTFIGLAINRIYVYAIWNFFFNRNIIFTYIFRLCVDRFLMCIRWIEKKFVKKRFFIKKWIFFYMISWRICSKGYNHFQISTFFRIFIVFIRFWTSWVSNFMF